MKRRSAGSADARDPKDSRDLSDRETCERREMALREKRQWRRTLLGQGFGGGGMEE